jgi:tetratricopeptide (TPR) repeat protein
MAARPRRFGLVAAATLIGFAISASPLLAAGDPEPRTPPEPKQEAPPRASDQKAKPDQKSTTKKKPDQRSEQQFIDGYRAARALVLAGKYAEGLAAFRALGHDDSAEVANYVGYTYRKLGDYDASRMWYEKALAADPNHVRTWQYYGMWHAEQGNVLKAKDFLEKVRLLCGTGCQEYQDLKGGIEGTVSY